MLCRGRTFFLPEVRLRKEAWTARPVGTGVWTRTGTGVATLDFLEHWKWTCHWKLQRNIMKLLRSKWWPVENRWTNEMDTLHQSYVRSGAKFEATVAATCASKPRAWPGIANFYGSGLSAQLWFFVIFAICGLGLLKPRDLQSHSRNLHLAA